ncbi:MAG: hypothetical protein M1833_005556 [Piccolia ochrophora]|nr:MAG: hypothetical protein M1833_005556 [Piccolia ochrophora]
MAARPSSVGETARLVERETEGELQRAGFLHDQVKLCISQIVTSYEHSYSMNMTSADTQSLDGDEWSEERLEDAMRQVNELHLQLRKLRTTIPRMIKPLTTVYASPEELFQNFSQAATTAHEEVKNFAEHVRTERSRSVLEHAAISRKENPTGINAWLVTENDGWLGEGQPEPASQTIEHDPQRDQDTLEVEMKDDEDLSGLVKIVDQARANNPEMKFELAKESKHIKVTLPPPARLRYIVEQSEQPDQKVTYKVSSSETSKLAMAILDCLTTRPNQGNLGYLLDMMAAYADIKSKKCHKCTKLLDSKPQYPTVRKREPSPSKPEQETRSVWNAYHRGCE